MRRVVAFFFVLSRVLPAYGNLAGGASEPKLALLSNRLREFARQNQNTQSSAPADTPTPNHGNNKKKSAERASTRPQHPLQHLAVFLKGRGGATSVDEGEDEEPDVAVSVRVDLPPELERANNGLPQLNLRAVALDTMKTMHIRVEKFDEDAAGDAASSSGMMAPPPPERRVTTVDVAKTQHTQSPKVRAGKVPNRVAVAPVKPAEVAARTRQSTSTTPTTSTPSRGVSATVSEEEEEAPAPGVTSSNAEVMLTHPQFHGEHLRRRLFGGLQGQEARESELARLRWEDTIEKTGWAQLHVSFGASGRNPDLNMYAAGFLEYAGTSDGK
eukprot:g11812.t1